MREKCERAISSAGQTLEMADPIPDRVAGLAAEIGSWSGIEAVVFGGSRAVEAQELLAF